MRSTSRRRFLQTAAATPTILYAQDKAGSKAPVLGSGEHTYEAIHDWGELPAQTSTATRTAWWKIRRVTFTFTTR